MAFRGGCTDDGGALMALSASAAAMLFFGEPAVKDIEPPGREPPGQNQPGERLLHLTAYRPGLTLWMRLAPKRRSSHRCPGLL